MRERIDPPDSPSQSSRKGISRLTALLDDPENKKQGKQLSRTTGTADASKVQKRNVSNPTLKQSPTKITKEKLSRIDSIECDDESSEYKEVSFHNALSHNYDEVTDNCYEDLTISTDASPSSTHDEAIQQYTERRVERKEDENKNDMLQFEKDMTELDLKLTMATDYDHSEEDLEMQPPRHDPTSYQKLVGPIDPSQKSNWKKSLYFLPCLLVLIVFIIVTPVIRKDGKEKSAAELVGESSEQPTITPPTLSPSSLPSFVSQSSSSPTFSPTLADTASDSSSQCLPDVFPPSAGNLDVIFITSSITVDYCVTQHPENLGTFERLHCFGTKMEYKAAGFKPNRFQESSQNP